MRRPTTRRWVAALALAPALTLSACDFDGVVSLPLPGTVGTGDDSYQVTVQLPDVGTLAENAEVKVDDVAVGTVTDVRVENWHAVATLSIEDSQKLPTDTLAKVGVNSLLGASYVELSAPEGSTAADLQDGDVLPLSQGGAYPSTEQVLAATSVVLNGSGLQQLSTITTELDRALGTQNGGSVGTLIPRLNSFVGALNAQKSDIITAIERLDQLGQTFADGADVIDRSLDALEPGLATLNQQRANLTTALTSLDRLSKVTRRLVATSQTNLVGTLEELRPTLQALNDSGDALVNATRYILNPPFSPQNVDNACRGDYCNLYLKLDLSTQALLENFTGATNTGDAGDGGGLLGLGGLLGQLQKGGLLGQGGVLDGLTNGAVGNLTKPGGLLGGATGTMGAKPGAQATPGARPTPAAPSGGLLGATLGGILAGGTP